MSDPIPLPVPPRRVGQATVVEQSRAVAEVQAAVLVAQNRPRDEQAALAQMRESCKMRQLADRAFFRYSRGGSAISGPSVYLARELARIWGNISHGVSELSRDDEHGQSELQAVAWDLEKNTRVATIFIVPHKRDKKNGPERLVDMRDIYENNANAGARRLRECIFGVLPPWLVEEAKDLCMKTITDGGGKPLPQRIADALGLYSEIGVTEDDLTRKLGRSSSRWSAHDVAQLGVIYQSIHRGEVARDEEFPPPTVTAEEIIGSGQPKPSAPKAPDQRHMRPLYGALKKLGLDTDEKRDNKLAVLSDLTTRPIQSSNDLTPGEADQVTRMLKDIAARPEPELVIAEMVERGREIRTPKDTPEGPP